MFITKEAITEKTGYVIDSATINLANSMIEAYIGRDESDVTEPGDRRILGTATAFQAAYIVENGDMLMEQAGVESLNQNDSLVRFDTGRDAPFMSPWAVMACKRLSWNSTRTVHTGPIFDTVPSVEGWYYE